jgi:hypothetical protein
VYCMSCLSLNTESKITAGFTESTAWCVRRPD